MKKIYLDYAATTPVDPKVLRAMLPYFSQKFGNPSSIHQFGQEARGAVDEARSAAANVINSNPEEVIFTSGGSEADNLAIRGLVEAVNFKPHLIVSQIEHHAVLNTVKILEEKGKIEATYLGVDKSGRVNPKDLISAIKRNTLLVSVMYVNSETGVIQPIREIGKMIEKLNSKTYDCHSEQSEESLRDPSASPQDDNEPRKIFFHTDAVQAASYFDLNIQYLHVDLMTLSAHKIYGPKGIGLLYLKKGTPLTSQITGGEQEDGRRAGTENVAGIVGFAKALELAIKNNCHSEAMPKNLKRGSLAEFTLNKVNVLRMTTQKLRDYFESKICREIKDIIINGEKAERAPHISNLSFKGAEGESILLSLDLDGIAASSGSACTSGSLEPSHVLMAMGVKPIDAQSSVRFSFGKDNTKQEIDYVIEKLKIILKRLRRMSPIK